MSTDDIVLMESAILEQISFEKMDNAIVVKESKSMDDLCPGWFDRGVTFYTEQVLNGAVYNEVSWKHGDSLQELNLQICEFVKRGYGALYD